MSGASDRMSRYRVDALLHDLARLAKREAEIRDELRQALRALTPLPERFGAKPPAALAERFGRTRFSPPDL